MRNSMRLARPLAVLLLVSQLASCASTSTGALIRTPAHLAEEGDVGTAVGLALLIPIVIVPFIGMDVYDAIAGDVEDSETENTYTSNYGTTSPSAAQNTGSTSGQNGATETYKATESSPTQANGNSVSGVQSGYTVPGSLSPEELSSKCIPSHTERRQIEAETCYSTPDISKRNFCTTLINSQASWSDEEWGRYWNSPVTMSDEQLSRAIDLRRYQLTAGEAHMYKQNQMDLAMYECVLNERQAGGASGQATPGQPMTRQTENRPVPQFSVAEMLTVFMPLQGKGAGYFMWSNSGDPCHGERLDNPAYESAVAQLPQDTNSLLRGAMVGIDLQLIAYSLCPDDPAIRIAAAELIEQRDKAMSACQAIVSTDNCHLSPF